MNTSLTGSDVLCYDSYSEDRLKFWGSLERFSMYSILRLARGESENFCGNEGELLPSSGRLREVEPEGKE